MSNEDAHTLWNMAMGVIAACASIIAFFARKHWADLEKRVEQLEAGERILVERHHQLALQQAESKAMATALERVEGEVRGMRRDLYGVKSAIRSMSPPPRYDKDD